nr:hypothetical protein [Sellimonas intestinalis]
MQDIQDALKDLLGRTIKEMLEKEMMIITDTKERSIPIMTTTGMITNADG